MNIFNQDIEELNFLLQSKDTNILQESLSKAQGCMNSAPKDKKNNFFNSKYSDLDSIRLAIKEPMSENGLSINHITFVDRSDKQLYLKTKLMHSSGQWTASIIPVNMPAVGSVEIDKYGKEKKINVMHALGSILTYLKRYATLGIIGITCDEDDDGNSSNFSPPQQTNKNNLNETPPIILKPISTEQQNELRKTLDKCSPSLKENVAKMLKERGFEGFHMIGQQLFNTLMNRALKDMTEYQASIDKDEQVAI